MNDTLRKDIDKYLAGKGVVSDEDRAVLAQRITKEIDEAVDYAEAGPMPDPSEVRDGVYR